MPVFSKQGQYSDDLISWTPGPTEVNLTTVEFSFPSLDYPGPRLFWRATGQKIFTFGN